MKEASLIVDKVLLYFLAVACKGEAFDVGRSVLGRVESEAWRRRCRRCEAKTVVLLRRCGEADERRLTAEFKDTLSDGDKFSRK